MAIKGTYVPSSVLKSMHQKVLTPYRLDVSTCVDLLDSRVVGRMYLLCWNASRVLHRTWMGTSRRRVCWFPSSRQVVACRSQPEKVHAHERPEAVASGRKKFL